MVGLQTSLRICLSLYVREVLFFNLAVVCKNRLSNLSSSPYLLWHQHRDRDVKDELDEQDEQARGARYLAPPPAPLMPPPSTIYLKQQQQWPSYSRTLPAVLRCCHLDAICLNFYCLATTSSVRADKKRK